MSTSLIGFKVQGATAIFLSLCLLQQPLQGRSQDHLSPSSLFGDTPREQLVRQYLEAFDAGDVAVRHFWEKVSQSDVPIDERLARYNKVKSDIGNVTPLKILRSMPGALDVLVQSANGGKLTMMFVIAEGVSPLLTGVRIEQVGDESPGTSQAPPKAEREILDDIKRLIENKSHADQFSGAILIARGPDVIWENAYGMADENFGIANQVTTRFDTGSIAKSFTRVAIAQLLEQGKLHLEDTIGHFLPDYPNPIARDKVTVSELLDMRSGIADFFGAKFEKTPRGDIRVLADYLPLFATEPLAFDPGTQRAYSNGGYIVLGLILEKASGETYYDYVQNHIFAPAGMNHSDFPFSDMRHDHEATGYSKIVDKAGTFRLPASARRSNELMMPARGSSAGSASTTIGDLFLYSRALASNVLVNHSTAEKLGLSGSAMGIAGGAPGLNASLETGIRGAADAEYTLIIMSNYDPPAAEDLNKELRSLLHSSQ
jgi:D-alanyl-D-alanine carboxypeptidase